MSLQADSLREHGPDDSGEGGFRLTGKHVLAILLVFFAVVFVVNGIMMRAAITTFSGVEAENPYKEGLAFNQRLRASAAQAARGWTVDVELQRQADAPVRLRMMVRDHDGHVLPGLTGTVTFEWPTDRRLDRTAPVIARDGGRYVAEVHDLPAGQWDVAIALERDGEVLFRSRSRMILR